MHHHGAPSGPAAADVLVVALAVLSLAIYATGVVRSRRRGRWPLHRIAAWCAGVTCVAAGLVGPIADAAHTNFAAHMVAHLLIGMLGPLLLVLAAPVTLALRALTLARARALTRLLRRPSVRVLTHPVVTALLNGGGLWVLYTTDLFALMHQSTPVYVLVHAHLVVAGFLFTVSLVGPDPAPRASFGTRAGVLIAFVAAHSILAKWLYANPPAGIADGRVGAQLMYYGGDAVDVVVMALLLAEWYRAAARPSVRR
ncbi:cytochrome c oxidase assembly protein [Aeromicrobium phragmitis]|uniref:Cytochrome c oxidase assembly protein n=1 Tax=Aeromicrobium phragmitis TaxID=2478914 RepID=A0A3L8PJ93_9ACTN|nr:cytochrome c oxidase assembly protein [Aeromicrobium phragmitis]RLV55280.1 cytochrome c oxidase assembly protein [Aeromicrobium phragmitis]